MMISIITVNLNNLRGLRNTMESILAQDSDQYEWIIIDGGSKDGCRELIEQNQNHLRYWVSEPDRGVYHAMNKGLEVASGDYLIFMNSGDRFADEHVLSSFIATHPTSDVIYGNTVFVDHDNNEVQRYIAPELVRLSYFWNNSIVHQGSFFNKRCFESFRYNEANRVASDTELFMQLLYNDYSFEKWDRFVDRFEIGGLSSQKSKDEFRNIVNRILPLGIKADYDEIIQFRDVDLYQTIRRIIASRRWVRNLARIVLSPFRLFLK